MTRPTAPEIELLRGIARDVAHELRGPVQSILVNLEVLRRRAQSGDASAVVERAEVIETEVRRLHELADAFLGLLRGPDPEPHAIAIESLLAEIDGIAAVRAKSARLAYRRAEVAEPFYVRVSEAPVRLAVLRAYQAVCDTLTPGDGISIGAHAHGGELRLTIEAIRDPARGEVAPEQLERIAASATEWLHELGGTAGVEEGSDTGRFAVCIKLPRAALTSDSP